jgi:transcriptional regulator with GAF, ATPase, and Fis domain
LCIDVDISVIWGYGYDMETNVVHEPIDLSRDLKELVGFATSEQAERELLRRGLDWLARVAPYDLATVFRLEGERLFVQAARGILADHRLTDHALSLKDFPTIRESIELRRARIFTENDHAHGDGDPFDAVIGLPAGHACMVVPLCAGEECLGVLTLDRTVCEAYPPQAVSLVEVYGQLLAVALQNARQKGALERLHEQREQQVRLLETERVADPALIFERSHAPIMREVVRRARAVAETNTPVLILGETGTGKEQLARTLHWWSPRADRPFVSINCAAIPAGLLESELFGHVKGAFTGAVSNRSGRFQMANGGTVLLDEIGELPMDLQAKLLRVLQEGSFEPVGSDRTMKVDARVLAATNVNLERAIQRKQFREDLYYRLSVFPLQLPPLRERVEDLALVCEVLLHDLGRRMGRPGYRISKEGLAKLADYSWPGNLRELANVLERAIILSADRRLGPEVLDLPLTENRAVEVAAPLSAALLPTVGKTLEEVERDYIRRVLASVGSRIYGSGGAAEVLGLKPSTLQSRMKKLGIRRTG